MQNPSKSASVRAPAIAALHRELGIPADYAAARRLSLQSEPEPTELRPITSARHTVLLLAPAADAWVQMCDAARRDGITLLALSGFRSIARQTEIIRAKLAAGVSLDEILRVNAAPGCSEHHSGTAVDISTPGAAPLEESFVDTLAFAWLQSRGAEFGFVLSYPRDGVNGIAFEPWHWRWQGPPGEEVV